MRKKNDREHQEQCIVIAFCELNKEKYPCLDMIYAIPNMGKHHIYFRLKQAAEGLKKGMLDLCLPFPVLHDKLPFTKLYIKCGLYIEMKIKPNKPNSFQKKWIDYFISVGYDAHVAYSYQQAIELIKNYINPDERDWVYPYSYEHIKSANVN